MTERGPARVIGVVDYGAGNLVSVGQALVAAGASVRIADRPARLGNVDALVVPGVGAARPAMERLRRRGLLGPVREWALAGRPFLGICLGLQLLFDTSDEDRARTLGVLAGRTVRVDGPTLPHIGWNQVERRIDHPLFAGIADGSDFYFVHSYAAAPRDESTVVAVTEHGTRFASAVASGDVMGVQFHPERSGRDGLRLLANFVALVAARPARTDAVPRTDPAMPLAAAARS